jgi:diketogulonate reductase-like aldo/keto reductase
LDHELKKPILFNNTDLPALGLGTSRLGHFKSKAEALGSLDLAYDLGIRYFDAAPIYTFGWSEKLLGTFAKDKREKVQIATKIGLQPSRILSMLPFAVLGNMRRMAKKLKKTDTHGLPVGVTRYASATFDSKWAIQSIEGSLRRLKTDYVDVLLLHESSVSEANAPETLQFMTQMLKSGKAKAIGIGSALDKLSDITTLDAVYTVVQHQYHILNHPSSNAGERIVNTYGLFQNIQQIKGVSSDQKIRSELTTRSTLDFSKDKDVLQFCLAGSKYEHTKGITLFSSTNETHIRATIASWNNLQITKQQFEESISYLRNYTRAS